MRVNVTRTRGVRVEHFSYPTRTRTRPVLKIATQPSGIPVARTRSLPVGLPLLDYHY